MTTKDDAIDLTSDTDDEDDRDNNNNNNNSGSSSSMKSDKILRGKNNFFNSSTPIRILDEAIKIKDEKRRNKYFSDNIITLKKTLKDTFLILRKRFEAEKDKLNKKPYKYQKAIQQLNLKIAVCMEIQTKILDAYFEADVSTKNALIIFRFSVENNDFLNSLSIEKGEGFYNYSISVFISKDSVDVESNSDLSSSDDSDEEFLEMSNKPSKRQKALRILNLQANATEKQIKKRYMQLARQLHPDKIINKTEKEKKEIEKKYQKVKDAYEALVNKLIQLKF